MARRDRGRRALFSDRQAQARIAVSRTTSRPDDDPGRDGSTRKQSEGEGRAQSCAAQDWDSGGLGDLATSGLGGLAGLGVCSGVDAVQRGAQRATR